MIRFLLVLFLLHTSIAHSKCNFSTGNYLDEMSNPSSITFIKIDIPKSEKFAMNGFKILTSIYHSIPADLKKKFKADIKVNYSFGECNYSGTIRQHGDLKDHIILQNGNMFRSYDVKLKDGNILNAVRFKLLIPETRNGYNEILGTLILKELGFIVPETFEVETSINGANLVMLFQEKASKELLERNMRREGPIFRGDERLIWAYGSFRDIELAQLSLSNLYNKGWFEKGRSSQKIILNSYAQLQQAHLKSRHKQNSPQSQYHFFPNNLEDKIYTDYESLLFAMHGAHALYLNNRKHYFNSLEAKFEPIYYDGNMGLTEPLDLATLSRKPLKLTDQTFNKVLSLNSNGQLLENFQKRVINKRKANKFFQHALSQLKINSRAMNRLNSNLENQDYMHENKNLNQIAWYKEHQKAKGVEQIIIDEIAYGLNTHIIKLNSGESITISNRDLLDILSKNEWQGQRVVYIPTKKLNKQYHDTDTKQININGDLIEMSIGMNISIDKIKKTLLLKQSSSKDWAMILGGNYSGWQIFFKGKPNVDKISDTSKQRFNSFGLTGCLTIYKSIINDAFISANNGSCEDSINLIGTHGKNVSLKVINAFADAVDADFSFLSIKSLDILNVGNDCFDVSGGNYKLNYASLAKCNDKAISVGEKSHFIADNILIDNAAIGISSKDSSKTTVFNLDVHDVSLCAEVKQKKQEFGGAKLIIGQSNCLSSIEVDSDSILLVKK